MPYTAEISRTNPSCFLFLIDQSGSMVDALAGNRGRRKCDAVADAINGLLHNLVIKCARGEEVRNLYQVGVLGYGAQVAPAFSGPLAGRDLVPLGEVAHSPARIEERPAPLPDGAATARGRRERFPVWFEPVARGSTPMGAALELARRVLETWLPQHPKSFPPIVLNITDGEATDAGPVPQAEALRGLGTEDGHVLLFNCHITSQAVRPVAFPDNEAGLADDFAQTLFQVSSVLPAPLRERARSEGLVLGPGARGFAFNADRSTLARFLDVGTRSGPVR